MSILKIPEAIAKVGPVSDDVGIPDTLHQYFADVHCVGDYWERTEDGVSISVAYVIKTSVFIRKIAAWNIGEPVVTFDQLWAGLRIDQLATDSHRVAEKAIHC